MHLLVNARYSPGATFLKLPKSYFFAQVLPRNKFRTKLNSQNFLGKKTFWCDGNFENVAQVICCWQMKSSEILNKFKTLVLASFDPE